MLRMERQRLLEDLRRPVHVPDDHLDLRGSNQDVRVTWRFAQRLQPAFAGFGIAPLVSSACASPIRIGVDRVAPCTRSAVRASTSSAVCPSTNRSQSIA